MNPTLPPVLSFAGQDVALVGGQAPHGAELAALCQALAAPRRGALVVVPGSDPEEPRWLARRLVRGPSLRRPLHPLVGGQVRALPIGDAGQRDAALLALAAAGRAYGLRTRSLAAVEQAVDELIENALCDAPRATRGDAGPPLVRFGGDARRFVVAVRDGHGALRRTMVLMHLNRCANARLTGESPILQGSRGAGVGLYLAACSAAELLFRLRPGRLTEVTCVFPVAPGPPRLRAMFFYGE